MISILYASFFLSYCREGMAKETDKNILRSTCLNIEGQRHLVNGPCTKAKMVQRYVLRVVNMSCYSILFVYFVLKQINRHLYSVQITIMHWILLQIGIFIVASFILTYNTIPRINCFRYQRR